MKTELKRKSERRPSQLSKAAAVVTAKRPVGHASAMRTMQVEIEGLTLLSSALAGPLAEPFAKAVALMATAAGRIIVTGIGKSGLVGRKIAATLSSTGTPAYFVHPSEASHGDLGMISRGDVVLALSWSGETAELASIITYAGRFAVPVIGLTSRAESSLSRGCAVALILPRAPEACPHGLAPTTSSLMQLALGDCLAMALLDGKGFTALDFKQFHPGGQLGASLRHLRDLMHGKEKLPLVAAGLSMSEALVTMTEKSFGCLGVVDKAGKLIGVITDGDLRRHMGGNLLTASAAEIMTKRPKTASPDMLAAAAIELMNATKITALFVVESGKPVGIVHVHDLLRAGVV